MTYDNDAQYRQLLHGLALIQPKPGYLAAFMVLPQSDEYVALGRWRADALQHMGYALEARSRKAKHRRHTWGRALRAEEARRLSVSSARGNLAAATQLADRARDAVAAAIARKECYPRGSTDAEMYGILLLAPWTSAKLTILHGILPREDAAKLVFQPPATGFAVLPGAAHPVPPISVTRH